MVSESVLGRFVLGEIDEGVFPVFPAINDLVVASPFVFEEDEGFVREFEFHDGVFLEHGAQPVAFAVNKNWFGVVLGFLGVIEGGFIEPTFFEVLDGVSRLGAVFFEEAGFVLSHSPGDFVDGLVDTLVHVLGFRGGFDDDVISTEEKDFSNVAVFL